MNRRVWVWLVAGVATLAILMALTSVVLSSLNGVDLRDILADASWQVAILTSIVAVLIVQRHPWNPLGWCFCAAAFAEGLTSVSFQYGKYAFITAPGSLPFAGLASWLGQVAWAPSAWLVLTYILQLFPTGRLLSPRWRILAWISVVPMAIFSILAVWMWQFRGPGLYSQFPNYPVPGPIMILWQVFFPSLILCGAASLTSLVLRYRRAVAVERGQIKWMAYAAFLLFISILLDGATPVGPLLARVKLEFLLVEFNVLPMPVAIGVAILRYHLWDIDIIIRRTVVYSILTAILAGVYLGVVVLARQVIGALTGQNGDLAIVISTLVVAALFAPLRRGIQDVIDRRLYRHKYDADLAMAQFAAAARDQVDLAQLSTALVAVVQDTVQPARMSLWLNESTGGPVKMSDLLDKSDI